MEGEGKAGQGWHLCVRIPFDGTVHPVSAVGPGAGGALRSGSVGILLSDRYVVYKKLARQWEGLELAFCWAHVRRDFFCLAKAWPEQEGWAMSWVEGMPRSEPASARSENSPKALPPGIGNSGRSGDWRGSAMRSWGARPCLKPAKRCCAASRDTGKG